MSVKVDANGDVLRAVFIGTASANANARTWRVKLGGTTLTTFVFTPNATAASWQLLIEILRTGSATQQVLSTLVYTNATAGTITFTGAWIEP